jgi:uncharacterized protein (TIGR02145 family)
MTIVIILFIHLYAKKLIMKMNKIKNKATCLPSITVIFFMLIGYHLVAQVSPVDSTKLTYTNNNTGITIGKQVWMQKNLDVETYSNGDSIPQVTNGDEWAILKTGAWCYFENLTVNGKRYGKLYNWYAVNDSRGLAPRGWHIPADTEWTLLNNYLGGDSIAGSKIKATNLWGKPNLVAQEKSGFECLPGGCRDATGAFANLGYYGYFWSAGEATELQAWYRSLYYYDASVKRDIYNKPAGFSVRCIRD